MNYRLQNADKTSGFTINTHQKCLKFDDKTPKNVLKFMQKMRQIFSELSVWRLRPKFYLKKPCVSLFVVGVLGANFAFGANIASLPRTLTLTAGEQKHDTAVSVKGNGQMYFFYDERAAATFTLNGGVGSKYTLDSDNQVTMFTVNSITLGQNVNLTLNKFHTIAVDTAITLGANSSLNAENSGMIMGAGGTEYGGDSKVRFEKNSQLTLGENASASFSRILFFIHKGDISLAKNSTLKMDLVLRAVRFEKSFTNNGGSLVLGSTQVPARVYNVGNYAMATFTQNGGSVHITGDFYNGGDVTENDNAVDKTGSVAGGFNIYDTAYSGGGDLILNGGTMSITGKLVSQKNSFGTTYNPSIKIYGATLIVSGGLENKQGSTITFGVLNGKMGEFQGTLKNEGGVVAVDRTGASLNTPYKIINGSANIDSVNLVGTNSQFFTATYNNGTVTITDGSGGGGGSGGGSSGGGSGGNVKFNEWQKTLSENEQGIVSVLSSKFGGDSKLLDSQVDVQTALADADKSVKDNLVSQPKNMLAAFKGDVLLAPMSQGRFVARRLAASGAVRFDNGRRVRALQAKPNVEFQLAPVGGVMKSADANGVLAGLSLGTNYKMGAFTHKTSLAYAYGTAKQDLSTQSTETKAHLLQAGVLSLYKYGIYETEFNANLLFGSFTIDNKWTEQSLNSSSKFNNYELNLGLLAGARYGKKLSFKPFVGVQNYGQRQDGFVGILGFESKAYNAYILDGVLGVQMQYVRSAFSSVYGKVSFERRLYNTHKFVFLRSGDNELKYENQSYESVVSAALGAQLLTYKRFKLNAEGFLRHYDTGLNYYGGSLVMRYRF